MMKRQTNLYENMIFKNCLPLKKSGRLFGIKEIPIIFNDQKMFIRNQDIKVIIATTKHSTVYESKILHVDIAYLEPVEVTVTDMKCSVPGSQALTARHVECHSYTLLFIKSSISNY